MSLQLPELPYAYDALQPYMSKETLEFHHDKHHRAYVDNGTKLLTGSPFEGQSLDELQSAIYDAKNQALINNVGQHYNHVHFWHWMKPNGGGAKLPGKLEKLVKDYGGFEKLRADFINAGVTQFGSGWCWLVIKDGKLDVAQTANGENPLMSGIKPILGCDVWEHSYYIDYRNARQKYLEAFIDNMVNWEYVEEMMG